LTFRISSKGLFCCREKNFSRHKKMLPNTKRAAFFNGLLNSI